MFPLFFNYFVRRTGRYFKDNRTAKLATVAIFLGIVLLLMTGIFSFFSHAFRFIASTDYFNDAVLLYLYELFLFAIFALVFVSAIITGLFNLFTGKDRTLIAVSPSFSIIPRLVLSRMFIASLWPVLIIVFPALCAIAWVYSLSFFGSFITLLALAAFVAFCVTVALCLIFLVAWMILHLKSITLRLESLTVGTLALTTLLFFLLWQPVGAIHLNTLFQAEAIDLVTANATPILERFAFLPSHQAALLLFAAGKDDLLTVTKSALIISFFLALATGCFLVQSRQHLRLWQIFQEGRSSRTNLSGPLSRFIARATGPQSAIFRRELVTFFRNKSGMTWFAFFCLIWLLQSGSMFILNHRLEERPTTLPFFVTALQVAATIYFVNMFVLRFAFPSFSMEQKVSRIIQSAPINQSALFIGRVFFYVPLLAILGLVFTLLNTFILGGTLSGNLIILGGILIASITVTVYGIALGVLFPNFETTDPEILSTSLPGLTFIFTSLLYGGLAASAVRSFFLHHNNFPLALFLLLSLILCACFIVLPYRKLSSHTHSSLNN